MKHNNIILFSSTKGHLHHLAEIGLAISSKMDVKVDLVHMPSPVGPLSPPIEGIEEFYLSANGFVNREGYLRTLFRTAERASKTWIPNTQSLILYALTWLMGLPFFYLLLVTEIYRNLRSREGSCWRQSNWRQVMLKTLRAVGDLLNNFPSLEHHRFGWLTRALVSRAFWGIWRDRWMKGLLDRFMNSRRPMLIILPELNWGYSHALVVDYCRRMGLPLLIVPYSMAGRQEWVESFKDKPECRVNGLFKRLVAYAFPEWTTEINGRRVMLPLNWLLSCEILGFSPNIPWVSNSGPDGRVAVDNEVTRDFYKREGVDVSEWEVIGSIVEDQLYEVSVNKLRIRHEFATTYGLRAGLPWVVIALPPNQYDAILNKDLPYKDYRELALSMLDDVVRLAANRWNVIINLHPRSNNEEMKFLERLGVVIIGCPLQSLLPIADLFVASASATIRWAIACGIPVVNYDVYRYGYEDFRNFEGVVEVSDPQAYRSALQDALNDSDALQLLKEKQQVAARRLFRLDGMGAKRMLALVNDLVVSRPASV